MTYIKMTLVLSSFFFDISTFRWHWGVILTDWSVLPGDPPSDGAKAMWVLAQSAATCRRRAGWFYTNTHNKGASYGASIPLNAAMAFFSMRTAVTTPFCCYCCIMRVNYLTFLSFFLTNFNITRRPYQTSSEVKKMLLTSLWMGASFRFLYITFYEIFWELYIAQGQQEKHTK
jgi:hypothetical protein